MTKRILLDMSSLAWKCLLVGKDKENGHEAPNPIEGRAPVWINSAEWGYEHFVNSVCSTLKKFDAAPREMVMVFDGENSKLLRQQVYPDYKKGRDHPEDSYLEFDKLLGMMKETLSGLGALACVQKGMEADDVLAFLCQNLKGRKIVVTNDGDLLALHGPDVDVYRDDDLNVNKYGPFSFKHITLWKALVGDSSDFIKGAPGFGPKKFFDLLVAFGEEGLDAMVELIQTRQLGKLVEDVAELKCLQKIIDNAESVYTSWDCARLYPEKVHNGRCRLEVTAGMVTQWDAKKHDERLKPFYGRTRIVHAGNYQEACAWAMGKLLESEFTALDIETSVPEESDIWLEEKKRSSGGEDGGRGGVDVLGSELTGLGMTFGKNQQWSLYFTVDHVETEGVKNVTSEQVRQFVELLPLSKPTVVQNASFELSVLYQAWGEVWKDNGYHGFLPNVQDTAILKSYVNENTSRGLKQQSKEILGYEQMSYDEVTQGRKMNQMTAQETVAYGADDTICTSALYTYHRFMMEIEHTWDVYLEVDVYVAYLNALRFVQGTPISIERMRQLEDKDTLAYDKAAAVLRDYLIAQGWDGTVCPKFETVAELDAKAIKSIYAIVTGGELKSQVRTPAKLVTLIENGWTDKEGEEHQGRPELAAQLRHALLGELESLNAYVAVHFSGEPSLNTDSPHQMSKLLYETLGLPVRLRNKATDKMREKGVYEGNPRTDDFSVQFALAFDRDKGEEAMSVLRAIQTMKSVATRRKLFYTPYKTTRHWRDQLVHAQMIQCQAVTRRPAGSDPNLLQLPKHPKHGVAPEFRQIYIPHKPGGVVVSIDFSGQELRNEADYSQDPALLACFVGDNKKDVHSLTATSIMKKKPAADMWRSLGNEGEPPAEVVERWKTYDYEKFEIARAGEPKDGDPGHPDFKLCAKVLRPIGKTTNFLTEYGGQAPKLSEKLVCPVGEAQIYLEAKLASFPRAEEWKREVIAEARKLGYQTTMMGARRHLTEIYSTNKFDAGRAERQAVNFKIQGSCAEQTKLAECRLWKSSAYFRYDARFIGSIYDELVSSVAGTPDQIVEFIREKHAAMTAPYASMKVPIVGSISLGPNFGEQIECGDEFDEVRIRKALQRVGITDSMTTA